MMISLRIQSESCVFAKNHQFLKKVRDKLNSSNECSKTLGLQKISYTSRLITSSNGPEDIAFDKDGNIFFGTSDGSIIKLNSQGKFPQRIANTFGRPLGLAFLDPMNLIIADANRGLLKYNFNTKQISILTNSHDNLPFKLTDDLTITSDGIIYFTDASSLFGVDQSLIEAIITEPNGRLLSYNPKTKETKLLLSNLYFPNGLALSHDETYLLLNESTKDRVLKIWLNKHDIDGVDVFTDQLPGFPDNINISEDNDGFWIALAGKRFDFASDLSMPDFMRNMIKKIPSKLSSKLMPKAKGRIIKVDLDGNIVEDIELGKCYRSTTSVMEHDGYLYLGSFTEFSLGRITAP